jgi:hypothetical protein
MTEVCDARGCTSPSVGEDRISSNLLGITYVSHYCRYHKSVSDVVNGRREQPSGWELLNEMRGA